MKRVYIDGEKLKAAMLNTGIKIKTICNGIGYQSDSFIYNAKQRGYIKERAVIDLERLYGIKRKLYEIPEPKNEVKPEPIDEQIHEPMKDWKASLAGWQSREKEYKPKKQNAALKYEQKPISKSDFDALVVDLLEA